MNYDVKMESSFSPEYAQYLGYWDAREFGTRHPHRSFGRENPDKYPARTEAYFKGLADGLAYVREHGLTTHCSVHWDNPGFDTPECGRRATYIGFPPSGPGVYALCDRHANQAIKLGVNRYGTDDSWSIYPKDWL